MGEIKYKIIKQFNRIIIKPSQLVSNKIKQYNSNNNKNKHKIISISNPSIISNTTKLYLFKTTNHNNNNTPKTIIQIKT